MTLSSRVMQRAPLSI